MTFPFPGFLQFCFSRDIECSQWQSVAVQPFPMLLFSNNTNQPPTAAFSSLRPNIWFDNCCSLNHSVGVAQNIWRCSRLRNCKRKRRLAHPPHFKGRQSPPIIRDRVHRERSSVLRSAKHAISQQSGVQILDPKQNNSKEIEGAIHWVGGKWIPNTWWIRKRLHECTNL